MNELEIMGLKQIIKEYIEEETDFKTRIDELEEDIQELQGGPTNSPEDDEMSDVEDEPEDEDPDLPEEEPLEDNPEREVHEEKIEQARAKPTGTRITKEDMQKLQNAPPRKKKPTIDKNQDAELDDESWDEEQ